MYLILSTTSKLSFCRLSHLYFDILIIVVSQRVNAIPTEFFLKNEDCSQYIHEPMTILKQIMQTVIMGAELLSAISFKMRYQQSKRHWWR